MYTFITEMPAPLITDPVFTCEVTVEVTPATKDSYSPDYGGTPGTPEEYVINNITDTETGTDVELYLIRDDIWEILVEESIAHFKKQSK